MRMQSAIMATIEMVQGPDVCHCGCVEPVLCLLQPDLQVFLLLLQ